MDSAAKSKKPGTKPRPRLAIDRSLVDDRSWDPFHHGFQSYPTRMHLYAWLDRARTYGISGWEFYVCPVERPQRLGPARIYVDEEWSVDLRLNPWGYTPLEVTARFPTVEAAVDALEDAGRAGHIAFVKRHLKAQGWVKPRAVPPAQMRVVSGGLPGLGKRR